MGVCTGTRETQIISPPDTALYSHTKRIRSSEPFPPLCPPPPLYTVMSYGCSVPSGTHFHTLWRPRENYVRACARKAWQLVQQTAAGVRSAKSNAFGHSWQKYTG